MASNISPEGYVFGSTPTPNAPFWDNSMNFSDITATAEIDNTAGNPSVELEVTKNNVGVGNLHFKFSGLKGQSGATGNVVADATVDSGVGTPSVTVEKDYVGEDTSRFTFNFHNLKGADGEKGEKGDPGNNGTNGTNGVTPNIIATATVDALSSDNPTVTVSKGGTLEAPSFNFAFSGLKGKDGQGGGGGGASYNNIYAANIPLLVNRIYNPSGSVLVPSEITKPTLVYLASSTQAPTPIGVSNVTVGNADSEPITISGTFDVSNDNGETYTEQTYTNKSLYIYYMSDETVRTSSVSTVLNVNKNTNNYGVFLPYDVANDKYLIITRTNTYKYSIQTDSSEQGEIVLVCQDSETDEDLLIKFKYNLTGGSSQGFPPLDDALFGKINIIRKDSIGYYTYKDNAMSLPLKDKNGSTAISSANIEFKYYLPAVFNKASTYDVVYTPYIDKGILMSGLSKADITSILESCTEV